MTTSHHDRIAADWLARHHAGLTAEEETEFQDWLGADVRHARAYRELEATWRLLDGVRANAPEGGPADPDALAPRRRKWRAVWLAPLLAAAAAIAIAYVGWWRPMPSAHHFVAGVTTPVGGAERLALPDGSVVHVNTDSRLEVRYAPTERRVWLVRGEAHFAVAKDPARPFFVEAGRVAVRAVGTAFNVRIERESIEVLVTEGRVRIAEGARGGSAPAPRGDTDTPLVHAGERAVIPVEPSAALLAGNPPVAVPVRPVSSEELERAMAWRDRRLEFSAAPLAEIVAEFNRYNRLQLRIDDPALAARRFGGSFRADDPGDFIRILQARFGVRVESRGGATVLRGAP